MAPSSRSPRQPPSWYANPYGPEISAFAPDTAQLSHPAEQRLFAPLESTPLTWVSTEEQLAALRDTLNACGEFALDLENHSYRSYRGFVCLMQISTRTADYLVDTLELRSSGIDEAGEEMSQHAISKNERLRKEIRRRRDTLGPMRSAAQLQLLHAKESGKKVRVCHARRPHSAWS